MFSSMDGPEFSGSLTPNLEGSPRSRTHPSRIPQPPLTPQPQEKTGEEGAPSKP